PPYLPSLRSIHRPPPNSTLFPYTTLFRSRAQHYQVAIAKRRFRKPARMHFRDNPAQPLQDRLEVRERLVVGHRQPRSVRREQPRDRKSTRLNSSHLGISYAVVCLKTKI